MRFSYQVGSDSKEVEMFDDFTDNVPKLFDLANFPFGRVFAFEFAFGFHVLQSHSLVLIVQSNIGSHVVLQDSLKSRFVLDGRQLLVSQSKGLVDRHIHEIFLNNVLVDGLVRVSLLQVILILLLVLVLPPLVHLYLFIGNLEVKDLGFELFPKLFFLEGSFSYLYLFYHLHDIELSFC